MTASVFKIVPATQKYDWGKVGSTSKVAQLANAAKYPGFTLEENSPYAELWMGTHPNAPSMTQSDTSKSLSSTISSNASLLGESVANKYSTSNLPYLFKVLSIAKALSIQTHPDKATAEILHKEKPNIYKDDNHKPEMALALTPFEALCGFRPLSQIATFLRTTPELTALLPPAIVSDFATAAGGDDSSPESKKALKDLFSALMLTPTEAFQEQIEVLVARYKSGGAKVSDGETEEIVELVTRLNDQFPGDIGIFCVYVLNCITLKPGEAIFLGAGEPHAYVSGDIMECMANSDNVIRAGLTPKLRDIPNLVSGLTYIAGPPTKHFCEPTQFSTHSKLYDPPIPEFSVVQTVLQKDEKDKHRKVDGPSIAIVIDGKGAVAWTGEKLDLGTGDVVFIGADTEVELESAGEGLTVYRAFIEVN